VRIQAKDGGTPSPDRQPEAGVEECRPQRRHGGRFVEQGLERGAIKIIKHEAMTVMIDEWSKIN
jgi:hypothetical protein